MLGPDGALGMTVLELYAGTGAVGFELLERGAAHVDFVEIDRRRAANLRREAQRRRLASKSSIYRADAVKILAEPLGKRYDLVFADPPYGSDPWEAILVAIRNRRLTNPSARIIAEHATRNPMPPTIQRLAGAETVRSRRYGDTTLTVLRFPEDVATSDDNAADEA